MGGEESNLSLEVLRPHQRPDEVDQKGDGNRAAENRVEHGSHLPAERDVGEEQDERGQAAADGDDVAHVSLPLMSRIRHPHDRGDPSRRGESARRGIRIPCRNWPNFIKKT